MVENLIGLNYMVNQGSGEYQFILADDNSLTINIKFVIDENGKVTYDNPTF